MNNDRENKILEGVIWKQIIIFFLPILFGTFFQQLYNTVDAIIVGKYAGKIALSSVGGSTSQIVSFVVGFSTGLTSGGSVLIAQYYGAKKKKDLDYALHTSYAFGILGGIVLGIIGVVFSPTILKFMNTPQELMEQSTIYLRIYFSGMIFVIVYNMGAAILRATGDSKRPLYYLIISAIINIILDFVLVLELNLGVCGVAIATMISTALSAILVTITLMKYTYGLKLELKKIRIHSQYLKNILKIGGPTGIQASMYCISNIIVQSALNLHGVDVMAAWTAYEKVDGIFWMVNNSFGIAITTFVGQNFGAGLYDRVRKGTRTCFFIAIVTALVFSGLIIGNGKILFHIFTSDENVISYGLQQVYIIAPTYSVFVFIEIFSGSLRAQGRTTIPTIITIIGICVLRIIWVTVICNDSVGIIMIRKFWGEESGQSTMDSMKNIIYCYPVSWIITAFFITGYYLLFNVRSEASLKK